jgi:CRP-like cAMP-binding protein
MPPSGPSAETFIASLPLFKELSEAQRNRIAERTRQLRVSRGEVLFRRGDPASRRSSRS